MRQNQKILIFSNAYYPLVGGAEIAIKEITDRLGNNLVFQDGENLVWDMITLRLRCSLPRKEKLGNINVYRIGLGISLFDRFIAPFWGAILAVILNHKNNYRHFWVVMVSFVGLSAYFAKIICFWRKISIVLTLQEGDSEEYFKRKWFGLINFFWKFSLKRTDILTVISTYLEERARRFGYKRQIHIVPNGVDIDLFKNNFDKEELLKIKKDLGFFETDKVIFSSSRLVEKNGLVFLIDSLKYLPQPFKLLIAGDGPLHDFLLNRAERNGVNDRIRLLGFVPHNDLPKFIALSFAFARPSLSEGFGNSFIEAMSVGVPVLATKVGGIKDFLREGENGLFVKVKSAESIAETLLKLAGNQSLAEKIVIGGEVTAKEYSWDRISQKMESVFVTA